MYVTILTTFSLFLLTTWAYVHLFTQGHPIMIGNIMIDLTTVNIDNNNVRFTLNWDEPFDNFDPIVNYTITINCSDASCPVMFTVTTTSASVSFITDLSIMTLLSVTATNTIGPSIPTTIIITSTYLSYIHMYTHTYVCMHAYVAT